MSSSQDRPPNMLPPAAETSPAPSAPTAVEKSPSLPIPAGEQKFWQRPQFVILVLLIVSIIILGWIINLQRERPTPSTSKWPQISPALQALPLLIESPQNEVAVVDNKVLVKGKTLPNVAVIIYSETDETSTESDNKGNFQGKITLVAGINTLTITAFEENGEEKTVTLDIVYDQES